MGRAKIKKKSTFIDMTAMSDVTVLLLTFFMLTSTFVKKEPVQVTTPASVSEIKIPEKNILQILVDPNGKIYEYGQAVRPESGIGEHGTGIWCHIYSGTGKEIHVGLYFRSADEKHENLSRPADRQTGRSTEERRYSL